MKAHRKQSGFWLLLLLLLPFGSSVHADLREDAARMGAFYSNRVDQIRQSTREQETDLLRKFIIALVRVEQSFKDKGDLEGLVATSTLRDDLISDPHFPQIQDAMPVDLQGLILTLRERRKTLRTDMSRQMQDLNKQYSNALEPLQRDLTRQGDIEMAIALREIRQKLELPIEETSGPERVANVDALDHTTFPICLEAPGLTARADLGVRSPLSDMQPVLKGHVRPAEASWAFRDGSLTLSAEAVSDAVDMCRRNQMFTLEFALRARRPHQGSEEEGEATPILLLGPDSSSANFRLTQEGEKAFFYLRTTDSPPEQAAFRIELGPLKIDRTQHFILTFRNGELVVYENGEESLRVRSQITGSVSSWEAGPLILGALQEADGTERFWRGDIVFVYLKASVYTQREIRDAFGRFSQFLTAKKPDEPAGP